MRVLILGGTKFIGPYVVKRLAEQGHEVTIFHRGETENDLLLDVRHIHGDFQNLADYIEQFGQLAPEVLLDMVPFTEEDGRRVKLFKEIVRRVVTISSCDVYRAFGRLHRTEPGELDPMPLTEDSPLREKLSVAGLRYNKTAVEREATSDAELPATILRLPATHGPGDYQHRLFDYIKRMDDQRPAILLDDIAARWQWSRGYVEDVAAAIALAITNEKAAGRIYNIAEQDVFTEAEWVREIAKVVGWKGEIIALPPELLPNNLIGIGDFRQHIVIDTSRIRYELGYSEVVPRTEALRRTIEWERSNPPEIKPEDFDYTAEDEVLSKLEHYDA